MHSEDIIARHLVKTVNGKLFKVEATFRDTGGHRYFSVTGEYDGCSGRLDSAIAEHFPEVRPVIAVCLSNQMGEPMHAVANALYFAEEGDVDALSEHLRISRAEARSLAFPIPNARTRRPAVTKQVMESFVDGLRPQWKRDADAAMAFLEADDSGDASDEQWNETPILNYVQEHNITVEVWEDHGTQIRDGWEHHAYTLTLHNGATGHTMERVPWKQGLVVEDSPTDRPETVLDSLVSDAFCGELSFGDFCADFGYDSDSRKAFDIYEACRDTRSELEFFVGGPHEMETLKAIEKL